MTNYSGVLRAILTSRYQTYPNFDSTTSSEVNCVSESTMLTADL